MAHLYSGEAIGNGMVAKNHIKLSLGDPSEGTHTGLGDPGMPAPYRGIVEMLALGFQLYFDMLA